jgi:PAS domain S-box-containing protein
VAVLLGSKPAPAIRFDLPGMDRERSRPIDPNATGAPEPLSSTTPGTPGRESHERAASLKRGQAFVEFPAAPQCAPEVPGLDAELLYTLVAENVRDYAIFLMDPDGIIRCWGESARLMKWWTKPQAEGSHLRMLYPDGGSEDGTAESHLSIAAETGEYNGEGHRIRNDGSTFWAYVTLTALRSEDGTLAGFTKTTRDFSARRAIESSLSQRVESDAASAVDRQETRLNQQVANLSHELRTPLNAILGSLSLMADDVKESDPIRSHVDRMLRNSRHLLAIVEDVLQLARAESGHLAISPTHQRLGLVIEDALADVEAEATRRKVTIANSVSAFAADLPYWGDPERVRQIIVNLLSNAIKFTNAGGRVTVSGGTGETVTGATLPGRGPWVYVRVEDTGRGIRHEELERIFEPFHQATPEDQRLGTGLGLSISRELARKMAGDLVAESQVGVGSRFTVWLPMAQSEPVPL